MIMGHDYLGILQHQTCEKYYDCVEDKPHLSICTKISSSLKILHVHVQICVNKKYHYKREAPTTILSGAFILLTIN